MSATKSWTPTRYPGLYKHANGTYYVRIGGNKTWKSLRTKVQSVALKLRDEVQREAERKLDNPNSLTLHGTQVKHAIAMRRWQLLHDASIKNSTRVFWNDIFQCVLNSWPGLEETDLRKISRVECEHWAGAENKKHSPSHFNNMVGALRQFFDVAIDGGVITSNPAASIKRAKPKSKDLLSSLPSREQFQEMVEHVRSSRSRWRDASGDLVEFLAYSGLRIGEAREVLWKHVDWERQELVVAGNPKTDGPKNRTVRRIPMIDDLQKLLEKMASQRPHEGDDEKVLLVVSAKVAMRKAAAEIGFDPITHHDMRHLFATTCIESGVDIPTVAYWLGHKDGGALAMKVYGHLRNEHSKAAAQRVSFSPPTKR